MRSNRVLPLFAFLIALGLLSACGGGGGGGGGDGGSTPVSSAPPLLTLAAVGSNVMTLTVNGSTCSPATSATYPNKPCVAVTMCDGNGNNCQTIDDILFDTGDFGFRIFEQALNQPIVTALNENAVKVDSQPVYECIEYGDGSTVWGPVALATLNGTSPVQIPIHVIGASANNPSTYCAGAPIKSSPTVAHYNGSLGLGILAQDCGSTCVSQAVGQYFKCSGGACSGTPIPVASQVGNPVASLPADNNGVLVSLPSVPAAGASSVTGSVIFGINTEPNNVPAVGVLAYGANLSTRYFVTTATAGFVNPTGHPYSGFLDTGSNGLFFNANIPLATVNSDFYGASLTLIATNTGVGTALNSNPVTFYIEDADSLAATHNRVFYNLGGPIPPAGNDLFDWGLPFFLGRNVYIGIEGRVAAGLATGPFWAY